MNTERQTPAVTEIRAAEFEAQVLRATGPVLVTFFSPWSQPCQILASALEQVASSCYGRARVLKINADDHPDLSVWYEIQSVPTLLFFLNGKLHARIVGTATEDAIVSKLQAVLLRADPEPGPTGQATTNTRSSTHGS